VNWRSAFKFICDIAGIAIGLYCAYRLIYAIAFEGLAARVIIGGLFLLVLAVYFVLQARKPK
jgi:hypothetical protein